MKRISTFFKNKCAILFLTVLNVFGGAGYSSAQTTATLGDPTKYIYGLSSSGQIFEINISNGTTNRIIKDATYSGNAPASANGLGYNPTNGKFYYFKRNFSSTPQEFVSFDPKTGVVSVLATSTITAKSVTGCISYDGNGYYSMDIKGVLSYYNIANDSRQVITADIRDQNGTDVDSVVRKQGNGDITFDGSGNLWIVTSSITGQYGVYEIAGPVPTASLSSITASRIIAPTSGVPNGASIAGIAFNANGQIFMSTSGDNLYLLENRTTLTFITSLAETGEGGDLTSLNFPNKVLPVTWISVDASVENKNNVMLGWKVVEYGNKGFYIQHSEDGSTWEDIGFIKSRNIAETEQTYSYTYTASLSGRQYYRIRQVDIDGKESFSAVKVLNFNTNKSTIAVWPNPARNNIYIDNNSGTDNIATSVQLYDFSGKLNIDRKLQPGVNTIDISSLSSGTYIITTIARNGILFSQKIVKQ
ncbi:MAG: T9SS type A sorting domain-containing protein [Bacteroidota bacterium]